VWINYCQLLGLIIAKYAEMFDCVFTAAVLRNRALEATCADVEGVVKLWLQYAADWSGGRNARGRRSPPTASTHDEPDSDISD